MSSTEYTNFARVSRVILDLLPDILRDLLTSYHQPTIPIILPMHATKMLNKGQRNIIANIPVIGDYSRCDNSLLYILVRTLCTHLRPTSGAWGRYVQPVDCTVADDIERIRELRNVVYGHAENSRLDNCTFVQVILDITDIVKRFDTCHHGSYAPYKGIGTYFARLQVIKSECMDEEKANEFCDAISALRRKELHLEVKIHSIRKDVHHEMAQLKSQMTEGFQQITEKLDPSVPDLIELIHEYKDYLRDQPASDKLIPRKFRGGSYPEKEILSHNAVFIKGEGGIGKSQYVQQLKRSWLMPTELHCFNEGTLMLFYDCKRLNKHLDVESNVAPLYFSSIWELLEERGKTSKDFNSLDLKGPYNDFVIVIDAIDELSVEKCVGQDCRDRLKFVAKNQGMISGIDTIFSIIYGITFPEAKLIVLGRQHEIENLDQMKGDDGSAKFPRNRRKIMQLAPFNGDDIKILTCKEVCNDQQPHDGNHKKCKEIYYRFSHVDFKKIPAYAVALIKCFQNEASTKMGDITKTKLFMLMTNRMLRDESPDDFKACVNVLAELSYNALFDELTIRTSRHYVRGDHIRFGNMELNRKVCERMDLFYIREDGDYIRVEPYHLTYLEFLASCYLIKHPRKWNQLQDMKKDRQILIIPFVAGLTSNDDFSNVFISEMLDCDKNPHFIKWLFDLDATDMNKLPGNENDECGDPKLWYGLTSGGKIMPPFKLLDAINAECTLTTDHMPKTVVKHNPRSSDEYYNLDGLVQLPLFANYMQGVKNIETFCAAFPGIQVEFKGNLSVEDDDAVEHYHKICQLDNVSLDDIDDVTYSNKVSDDKVA